MTLKSPEKLLEIIEARASGMTCVGAAMSCGVAARTFWWWLKLSKEGDPDFLVEYLGEEMQFVRAMTLAREIIYLRIRDEFERRSLLGHEEKIFFQGRPSWVEFEAAVGLDEDTREMLGYPRDGLARDADGNRIQHTLHHMPPIQAQLRALEVAFPEFTPGQRVETTVTNRNPPAPKPSGPPVIPPPPVPPAVLAAPIEDGEFADILGPEPVAVEPRVESVVAENIPEPVAVPDDMGPVIKEAGLEIAPSSRPISPTLAGLLRR
jgi:hypothetical protein